MTKYFERKGVLYEFSQDESDCSRCAFRNDSNGCEAVNIDSDCSDPEGVWVDRGTQGQHVLHRACSDCLHVGKTFAEAPCNQCRGSVDVPVGFAPKWEVRSLSVAKPAGPVTVQLVAARNALPLWSPADAHKPATVVEPMLDISKYLNDAPPVRDPDVVAAISEAMAISQATGQYGDQKPTNPKDLIGVRKVPMSTVPAGVMMDVALALHEGACKYGRHNYRGVGVRASVYYDAAMGHQMDWWEGDDIDAESGLSHVTKAIASLVVLRDAMLQGKLTDDRPPRSKVFKRDFNGLAGEILDRHADKSPRHWTIADSEIPSTTKGLS